MQPTFASSHYFYIFSFFTWVGDHSCTLLPFKGSWWTQKLSKFTWHRIQMKWDVIRSNDIYFKIENIEQNASTNGWPKQWCSQKHRPLGWPPTLLGIDLKNKKIYAYFGGQIAARVQCAFGRIGPWLTLALLSYCHNGCFRHEGCRRGRMSAILDFVHTATFSHLIGEPAWE